MCGIVGYVGGREACPVLLKGLHRLEYRGYDSAGVAMVGKDGALNVYKCKGKVSDLEHFLEGKELGGSIYENTGDAVTTVTLDDGTHVWLNARTKLTLPEAFGPTQRNVQLAGAAFFEVARDEAAPFVVSTDKLRVRVLGTSFCMQAYEGSQQAEVVLEHGSVRLQTPAGVNLVTLQPDQRALYDAADDNLAITQVNASHLVLTQYDLVTMSDATLHEIISHIETTFGVRLSVPGRYGDKRYTFNYQRSNSLEEVLNIVEYLTGEHCEVIYRKK